MTLARRRQFDDLRWETNADWESVLLDAGGLRLKEWLAQGNARVVKEGPHRTVYRVDLPQRAFYVKHYRSLSWRDAGRSLVRSSNARRECKKTREVARRGLPTATPVAIGEQQLGPAVSDSFLVTEAIPNTRSLIEFIDEFLPLVPPRRCAMLRRKLIDQLAGVCAQSHAAGILQTDMHAGNVLVQYSPPSLEDGRDVPIGSAPSVGELRLFLIDLPTVRFSGSLGWPASRNCLAMLCSGLMSSASRSERWRFWRSYLAARTDLPIACPRRAAAEIFKRAKTWSRYIAGRRDRRCLKNNRDFYGLKTAKGEGRSVNGLAREQLAALLSEPDAPLRSYRHQAVKISHSSLVVQAELELAAGPIRVAYKRSRIKSWWKARLMPFRPSRAKVGWRRGHALLARGIATARPILLCEPAKSRDAYLGTEWIDGAEDLHLYGWRLAELAKDRRNWLARRCLETIGRLVGRMHAWNVAHRDLKGGNMVVVEKAAETDVYLIDLDGIRIRRRLNRATRVRNLARLAVSHRLHSWVSRTLLLRFLLAYLKEFAGERRDWKRLWRDIACESEKLALRIRRRGRTVA